MTCAQIRESLSALADGEPAPLPLAAVHAHCAGCAACRQFEAALVALGRAAAVPAPVSAAPVSAAPVSAAEVSADFVTRVVTAAAALPPSRAGLGRGRLAARLLLAAVALMQLLLAAPELLLGHDREAPVHVAHEVGSFGVALAIALLLAAWRPGLASGMLPVVGVIAGLLLLTAGLDLGAGRTTVADEAPHLLEIAGFLLLRWLGGWRFSAGLRSGRAVPSGA